MADCYILKNRGETWIDIITSEYVQKKWMYQVAENKHNRISIWREYQKVSFDQ